MLDEKEERALEHLDRAYEKFMQKSLISRGADIVREKTKEIMPEKLQVYNEDMQKFLKSKMDIASSTEIWKKVMKLAGEGFIVLQGVSAKHTIDEKKVIKKMQEINSGVDALDKFDQMRSYQIEKIILSNDWKLYVENILQAASTGAVGAVGIPFNIILATFIQFRTIQLIAMHYGYDVKGSQVEMDYASSVYLQIISKGKVIDTDGYGEIISKMMAQAELGALRKALRTKTYGQMIQEGGIQLIYVQIRAIANRAAKNAIGLAGQKEIENKSLKKILQAVSEKMSQRIGAKAIPGISAILNVLIDTRQIYKIIKMSNVIYQKRFLLDKEMGDHPQVDDKEVEF
jgi:hypothetical protein